MQILLSLFDCAKAALLPVAITKAVPIKVRYFKGDFINETLNTLYPSKQTGNLYKSVPRKVNFFCLSVSCDTGIFQSPD